MTKKPRIFSKRLSLRRTGSEVQKLLDSVKIKRKRWYGRRRYYSVRQLVIITETLSVYPLYCREYDFILNYKRIPYPVYEGGKKVIRDLRDWLDQVEAMGDLQKVNGAHWDKEIGGIVDLYQRKMGLPALLFDEIQDYPKGYRIVANSTTSLKRIALSFGLPTDISEMDLIQYWRNYLTEFKTIPAQVVSTGSIMENVSRGDDVRMMKFPTPLWHELDGGRFIGTGCMVLMRDPDSGWVNFGAYRVQVYDDNTASVMISKGKQGAIIMQRYFDRGLPCPVVVVVGMDPLLYMMSGMEIPYGVCEYDVAGALRGEAIPVINGEFTGIPIPADAEIAFEGEIVQGDLIDEGPFGEWTGYYASGERPQPVIRVKTLYHRNDPIILGAVPAVPPCDDTYYRGYLRCASIWDELEKAGISGVKGVWTHEAGGGRMWVTVSIKQMYGGHAKQAGLIASQCHAGAYANRWTIVVDDDINPAIMDEVVWAMCTRVDPREDVEILRGNWSTALDPMSYPNPGGRNLNSRLVIDACRPWGVDFPPVAESSPELKQELIAKWPELFTPEIRRRIQI